MSRTRQPTVELETLRAELEPLRRLPGEINRLRSENERLRLALAAAKAPGRSGWLMITPNAEYSGVTMGTRFDGGLAFLPDDDPGSDDLARQLFTEFGYAALHVTGWTGISERLKPAPPPKPTRPDPILELISYRNRRGVAFGNDLGVDW
jgi:hypothetical protein